MKSTIDLCGPLTDDEIAQGLYSFRELVALGIVKDRTDLQRKQKRYNFPQPLKLGDRQAAFLRARVHAWVRQRATQTDHLK